MVRELGLAVTFSDLNFPKVGTKFDEKGNLLDEAYENRVQGFLDELSLDGADTQVGTRECRVEISSNLSTPDRIIFMTSEQHNRYVAYSFLAYAGFQAFWLLIMILWFYFIFGALPGSAWQSGVPAADDRTS
jgi:hypothetical protein